jgi:hypothetical protein
MATQWLSPVVPAIEVTQCYFALGDQSKWKVEMTHVSEHGVNQMLLLASSECVLKCPLNGCWIAAYGLEQSFDTLDQHHYAAKCPPWFL